ncbi:MAG: T9SS type A sorting domain-containing protein, partial [Bacteroidales bacterium]|nr:T9SS type A sorting domain-containing protein [Bacteroidales bacterium]
SWREVTTGSYTKIASAGNGVVWAICNNGNVARICVDCNTDFTISSQPETCDGISNARITISATGASSYSIDNGENWQTSGSFASISGGYKHLLAKNSAGKIIADSVFFVEYGNALQNQNLTYIQPDCFGETGSLSLSNLGVSTFVWENGNTAATERTNLGSGTYAVTITSSTCTRVLSATIVAREQILINATSDNLLCNGDNSGRIALNVSGGTSPYSYEWNNGAETATLENIAASEYSCTVTDRNSCTVSQSFTITQPDSLLVQTEVTNLSCWNSDDGAISVSVTGGTQPYSYLWNDGVTTADRTNLYAVTYGLMVTDANGCNVATFPTVWHPDPITFWVTNQTDITCFGANDGTISTGIRGGTRPYSYTWSDEATTANRTDLSAGYYRLTVTDANSCVATLSANVTEPEELVAVANVSPIICAGDVAQLSASATGGTGTYAQYFWFREENTTSPVCVQPNYQNVAPGTYYLVAKDSHNCTDTIQVVVEDAEPHNFVVTVTDATCNGASNGAISITPDGGFSFAWSNDVSNTNNANSLSAGIYSVTITDASDCTTVIDTVVAEPEMPLIGSFDDMVLCEGQTFTLDAGSYASYQWSNDATSQTIIVDAEGDYSVTVTDNMGCRLYDEVNISFRRPYTGDKLALASVTETNSVILRWNKTDNQGTASYRIYRDSGDGFLQIATVGFNNEPKYEDTAVNVNEHYYKYKVTAVSNCGDESEVNDFHRTIVLAAICDNNNVCNLNWSPYMGITETFTYLLAGDSPETLEVVDSVLFNTYNYIQMNQYEGGTYYRIMIKMSHPLVLGDEIYDRIYSNIVRCGGNDEPPIDPPDPPVAITIDKIGEISAYPNPFGGEITIEFGINGTETVAYEVVNTLGQIVINGKVDESPIKFGTELNAGMYFVRLRAGDEVHTIKISKQ